MQDDPEQVVCSTRRWVEQFVIGLGLCPFAAKPAREGSIRYQVCNATAWSEIRNAALQEMLFLFEQDSAKVETSLLLVPEGLGDFFEYLDMLDELQVTLEKAGLQGILQIASFHPDYRFEGVPADDPANYTNRSPYPTFHFIREAQLAEALAGYREPESIPDRNVRLLRGMPRDELLRLALGATTGDSES